jgi:phage/plasmid-like protein (TIGR03299 family)
MATPTFSVTDDLSWSVEKRPLYFTGNDGQPVAWPEKVAVVRSDTGRCLGVVSKDYETVQNSDLLSLIQPMVEEGLLTIENTGYLNHGSRVFAQARLNEEYKVIGEDYKAYVTLLNSHNGSSSVSAGSTMHRVICGNSFAAAYRDIGERFRHNVGVTERFLSSSAVIEFVNGAMEVYANKVDNLATSPCSSAQFRKALELIYQKEVKDMRTSFVDKLNDLFYNGKGNEGRTMYDCLNAVTEYSNHHARKTKTGNYFYANFGQGANTGRRAMAVLEELAAV